VTQHMSVKNKLAIRSCGSHVYIQYFLQPVFIFQYQKNNSKTAVAIMMLIWYY